MLYITLVAIAFSTIARAAEKPDRVLVITAEREYRSEESLSALGEILSEQHQMQVTHLHGFPKTPGLSEALAETDLLILYARFVQLPDADVAALRTYLDDGGAFIACRTSTHLFKYPKGSSQEALNEAFPAEYFGTPYLGHHGHRTSQLNYVMGATHPILRGIEPRFWTPDFLYGANPIGVDCHPLIVGQALRGNHTATFKKDLGEGFLGRNHCTLLSDEVEARTFGTPHPVLWTVDSKKGGRGIVNTIGAPGGFATDNVKRLYINSVYWCLQREDEIPVEGSSVSAPAKQAVPEGGVLTLAPTERVVWIGNTLAERMQEYGHLETEFHALHPTHNLVIRNHAWSADTVSLRPRPDNFGDIQAYLRREKADVILACYGLNETWDYNGEDGLAQFETDLTKHLQTLLSQKYNGKTTPRLVLFSPIACEDSGVVPDVEERNRLLELYSKTMAKVAQQEGVEFVDLFTLSRATLSRDEQLTSNGIHLTSEGYARLTPPIAQALFGQAATLEDEQREKIRREVLRKNRVYFDHYRAVNSVHIHGGRTRPYGSVSFPPEREKLMQMTEVRDARIWDAAAGKELAADVDDSSTRAIPATIPETGDLQPMPTPQQIKDGFTMGEGFEVNLFASEVEFPDIKNPSSMLFDAKGRLWLSTMPSYPHALPGVPVDDKILILEDTDGDGKADKQTVFADGLYLPLGFEIGFGGAFVSQEPNLVFLQDTDGDEKADERTIVLSGFGTEDSHHAIHDLVWGPGGGLYMQESVFLHSQVETAFGPRRMDNAGMFRFDPRTQRLEIPFRLKAGGNAWGHAIDRWGAHLYIGKHLNPGLVNQSYPGFTPTIRKTTGDNRFCEQEFITSRHFPDEYQGKVFSNIYKHYHGVRLHDWSEDGSGYKHDKILDVLHSRNTSHIPVDLCLGPDGALYITDWSNQVLGHAQASLRYIKRDHDHGRIWRITYKDRPLATPPKLVDRTLPELLDFLKAYEDRTRYRARRLIWEAPDAELKPALSQWLADLDPSHADVDHHRMEALWLHQQRGWINPELLEQLLTSQQPAARAAATDLLRFWWQDLDNAAELFRRSASDPSPKVRLAALVSGTWTTPEIAIPTFDTVNGLAKDGDLTAAINNARRAMADMLTDHPLLAAPEYLVEMEMTEQIATAIITRSDVSRDLRLLALKFRAESRNTSLLTALLEIITELESTSSPAPSLEAWLTVLEPDPPTAKIVATVSGSKITVSHSAMSEAKIDSIVISVPGSRKIINLCELQIFSNGKDIASTANLAMSSQHDGFPPSNLVDGDLGTMAHTSNATENNPWIRATFDPPLQGVDSIEVTNRGGSYGRRFHGGLIVANSNGQPLMEAIVPFGVPKATLEAFSTLGKLNGEIAAGGAEIYAAITSQLQPSTRQALIAATLRAGTPVAKKGSDYFYSSALLVPASREQFSQVANEVLAAPDSTLELREAAIFALGQVHGNNETTFDQLAALLDQDDLTAAAAKALMAQEKSNWPQAKALALLAPQFERLQSIPIKDRAGPRFTELSNLLREIASLKGADIAPEAITALQPQRITVATHPGRIQFNKKRFSVRAGAPVALTFDNDDAIIHNLVIIAPDSLDKVGPATDLMAADPNAIAREWIPDLPEILHHTPVAQPKTVHTISFIAPETPGKYPFICSVPGHWRLMNGIMVVE